MPLSIFTDALPYSSTALHAQLSSELQLSPLRPNVGYSASLHRQLYCDRYPDDTGVFVDWVRAREPRRAVRVAATLLRPLDLIPPLGAFARKGLDHLLCRGVFANVPFCHRARFCNRASYLFREPALYRAEPTFDGYHVISQDALRCSFAEAAALLRAAVGAGERNLFFVTGVFDEIGHRTARGDAYEQLVTPALQALGEVIRAYRERHPDEEILLLSDHGMSTVRRRVPLASVLPLTRRERRACIVYTDSCVCCVFCEDGALRERVCALLDASPHGHRLTRAERMTYRVTDEAFGQEIFVLREGNVFSNHWFGRSWRRSRTGEGMHGFYPEPSAPDQQACVGLYSPHRTLQPTYTYPQAHALVRAVMQGEVGR